LKTSKECDFHNKIIEKGTKALDEVFIIVNWIGMIKKKHNKIVSNK